MQFSTRRLVTISLLLSIVGCGDDNLPEPSFVNNLRVLALKSDPVTVQAGANPVTFTALVADPKGGGRSLTYTWEVCPITAADSTGTACTSTVAANTTTTTSDTPTFTYTNNLNGGPVPMLVVFTARAGGETRTAIRNLVVVSATTAATSAPDLSEIKIDGASGTGSVSVAAGRTVRVEAVLASGNTGSSFMSWVTSAGSLGANRTLTSFFNDLSVGNERGTHNLYAIFNDGSGGVDFVKREFVIP